MQEFLNSNIPQTLFWSAIILFVYLNIAFFIAIIRKDNSAADVAWGLGFIVLTIFTLLRSETFYPRQLLTTLLVVIWGIRLSTHIYLRNKGKPEDWRYRQWREDWGERWIVKTYLNVFLIQGVLLFFVVSSALIINTTSRAGLTLLDLIGVTIWLIGFFFETIGDFQLLIFKRDPKNKGKILMTGLWQYTRHPNYFGEFTMWVGIGIIAISVPFGGLGLISPIVIGILLRFVSGVPMLEKRYEGNKEFEEYKKRTNAFVPWINGKKLI